MNVRGKAIQGRALCVHMVYSNLEKSVWSGFWHEIAGKSSICCNRHKDDCRAEIPSIYELWAASGRSEIKQMKTSQQHNSPNFDSYLNKEKTLKVKTDKAEAFYLP